jgi:hypothetical protein
MRQATVILLILFATFGCSDSPRAPATASGATPASSRVVPRTRGNPAIRGGTPTVRRPYERQVDNPATTNDESNDQPIGHFGSETVTAHSYDSGNTYTLDADVDGTEVSRIYFPKGGWVDFSDCELDSDGEASCTDEEGRLWDVEADAPDGGSDDEEDESSDDEDESSDDEDE